MKILWLCNTMLPVIAEDLGLTPSNKEGWLAGLSEQLKNETDVKLGVCFPYGEKLEKGCVDGITYYGFWEDIVHEERYDLSLDIEIKSILDDFQPDIVHIFGTEFAHTLSMVKTFEKKDRILIGMQGVCSVCAKEYMADLPEQIQKRKTFRDWVKKDSIQDQQNKFYIRAKREEEAVKLVTHITGRTRLDLSEVKRMNPEVKYHFMNETLRSNFYEGKWDQTKCRPYSIFLSQGNYPLKGAHYVLQAMTILKEEYPSMTLQIAGDRITGYQTLKEKIKISSYGKYLLELIRRYELEDQVVFLGKQSAEEMYQKYMESNTFICASSVENSPNSLGEAMLLGMPVISSQVGGVPDMLTDGVEGLLFEKGNVGELADCIGRIFRNPSLATILGENARKKAYITHDPETNKQRLLEIYKSLITN